MKRAALAALCVAACAPEPTATVVEVPPQEAPPPPTAAAPALVQAPPAWAPTRSGDEWVGTYTCAQGETDLALHVRQVRDGTIEAVFDFSHAASGASGAYVVVGNVLRNHVTLQPQQWLRRPPGYVMVGMRGEIRGDTFSGRIDDPSCEGFSLRRR